jgi:hypothetical protein
MCPLSPKYPIHLMFLKSLRFRLNPMFPLYLKYLKYLIHLMFLKSLRYRLCLLSPKNPMCLRYRSYP